MENHPIESWDQWIHSNLHPAVLLQSAWEVPNTYLAMAKELKVALEKKLLRDTLYNKTGKEIELLIERYQIKVASLLDLLFNYQHNESITPELKQFYESVAAQLESIIILLQNDYGRYYNSHHNRPLTLRLREAHEVKRQWKRLLKPMSEMEANDLFILFAAFIQMEQEASIGIVLIHRFFSCASSYADWEMRFLTGW